MWRSTPGWGGTITGSRGRRGSRKGRDIMFSLCRRSSVGLPAYTFVALSWTAAAQPYTTWKDYGGASDSMQYSALRQINKGNVARLELAWSHLVPATSG